MIKMRQKERVVEKGKYKLEKFEIMKISDNYYIYGSGKGADLDKWNTYHGRLPGSPAFNSYSDAVNWLFEKIRSGELKKDMIKLGHLVKKEGCPFGCDKYLCEIYSFNELKEVMSDGDGKV